MAHRSKKVTCSMCKVRRSKRLGNRELPVPLSLHALPAGWETSTFPAPSLSSFCLPAVFPHCVLTWQPLWLTQAALLSWPFYPTEVWGNAKSQWLHSALNLATTKLVPDCHTPWTEDSKRVPVWVRPSYQERKQNKCYVALHSTSKYFKINRTFGG